MKVAWFRRVPAPLLVALGGGVAWAAYVLVNWLTGYVVADETAYKAVTWGASLAIHVLAAVGLAALARELRGTARFGLRMAMVGTIAWIALGVLEDANYIWWLATNTRSGDTVMRGLELASGMAGIATMAGLGIAARRWYWIAIAIVFAVPEQLPSLVGWHQITALSELRFHALYVASGVSALVSAVLAALLVIAASRDVEPEAVLVTTGPALRRIRLALYAMMTAVVLLPMCSIVLGERAWSWWTQAAAMTFELAGLFVFALALLRTGELPRWLALASASLALCVAGHTLSSVAQVVRNATLKWGLTAELETDLPSQLLASCAVGGVLVAIAIAARRRGLDAQRRHAMAMTGVFAALALGAVTVQQLANVGAPAVIASTAALVASMLVAAAVVGRGAVALEGGAQLPAAQVVRQ